jgi:hypothetical protein
MSSSSSHNSHKEKERKGSTSFSSSLKFSTSSGFQSSRKHSDKKLVESEAESAVVIENSVENKDSSPVITDQTNRKTSPVIGMFFEVKLYQTRNGTQ